jgi:hypothetical protein
MSRSLFLIFNHQFTPEQKEDARSELGVHKIVTLPEDLRRLWSDIPPCEPEIKSFLNPIETWLSTQAQKGDYVLIQGDFGGCFIMVNFSLAHSLIPIYSTTERMAIEEGQSNGAVKVTHHFQHQIFRRYGR